MNKGLYILILFAVIAVIESCKNNDNVFPKVTPAYLNVVNASADTLNYYLNGTRQNNGSSLFPGGQSFYNAIPAGAENVQFKKSGAFNVLFSYPIKLQDSTNYSLYVTGETAAGAFNTVDFLTTAGIDTTTNFKLRFVNASPDAGSLDVTVDSASYKNCAFQSSSAFLLYGSGPKEVKVFPAGSSTASIDTVITFQQQHAYTLFSKGVLKGKGTARFNVAVAINL